MVDKLLLEAFLAEKISLLNCKPCSKIYFPKQHLREVDSCCFLKFTPQKKTYSSTILADTAQFSFTAFS